WIGLVPKQYSTAGVASAATPSRVIDACGGCLSSGQWPSSATGEARNQEAAMARPVDGATADESCGCRARQQGCKDGLGHCGSQREIQRAESVDGGMRQAGD